MPRYAPLVLALGLILTPVAAFADKSPAPTATPQADQSTRDGSVIEGRVTSIDYGSGVIGLDSTTQGKVDVTTTPTTSVQGSDPGYHTLSDVTKGSRVRIWISKTTGKLVAQIIRLISR